MAKEIPGTHFVGEVAQKVIIKKDGKILLCQDVIDASHGYWDLPGGRLHKGETPEEGLRREIQEELGIAITDLRPIRVSVLEKPASSDIPRFFLIYSASPEDPDQDFTLAEDEIVKVQWFGRDEISDIPIWDVLRDFIEEYSEHL